MQRTLMLSIFAAVSLAWAGAAIAQPVTRTALVLDFSQAAANVDERARPDIILAPTAPNVEPADSASDLAQLRGDFDEQAGVAAQLRSDFVLRQQSRLGYLAQLPPVTPGSSSCLRSTYRPTGFLSRQTEARRQALYPLIVQSACRYRLPVALFDALVIQESRYQVDAQSPVKAYGLAQLMPATARDLGVNPYSVWANLDGGARYLKAQLDRFVSPHLALAAYNAGPSRVARRWSVPNIAETQNYVRQISRMWRHLSQPMAFAARASLPINPSYPHASVPTSVPRSGAFPNAGYRLVNLSRF